MSTYQLGLTGRAAEWAVRKQKQHLTSGNDGVGINIGAIDSSKKKKTMKCLKEVHTIDFFAQKIWPNENLVGKTRERVFWMFLSSLSPNLKLVSCRKIWFSLYVI